MKETDIIDEELKKDTITVKEKSNPFYKMLVARDLRNVFDEKQEKKRKLFVPFFLILVLLYLEFVFHIYSFGKLNLNTIAMVLFSTSIAGLIGFVCSLFPPKVNYILTIVVTVVLSVYFCVQIIYKGVFQNYLSLSAMMGVATQALDYKETIMKNVLENIVALILFMIPVIVILTPARKLIRFTRKKPLGIAIYGITPFVLYFVAILFIKLTDFGMYSAYDIFKDNTSIDMAIEKLGLAQASVLDAGVIVGVHYGSDDFEFSDAFAEITQTDVSQADNEEANTADRVFGDELADANVGIMDSEQLQDTTPRKEYNVLDIDFEQLIADTDDSGLISLNEYFRDCVPTKTNDYTGMFEGYNVIFVTAEGFSGYALTEENYPTIYKMANNGFVFNNYYSPLWYGSTVGGEYANLTGLIPANGQYLSLKETGKCKNSMRLTLATQLSSLGYATVGYHDNTYTYYGRDMSHTNMGYTWVGVGNGWAPQTTKSGSALWPQSDDYMVETTFYDYCATEPFHTYYLSVSGHVQYNFTGNAMAIRNKDVFAETEYSDTTKAYLSCQYELEKAMTRLVDYLEEEGIADHTLIVLAPDHVPYDNKDVCDELAGYELEDNFEWFENTLIIWSASMEEPVQVDKVCSSIDILPTVSNLMGLEYDSRLLVGRDILSDCEGLVMFNNRSWITDQCMYNAKTGEITSLTGEEVSEDYIKAVKSTVQTRFKVSDKILEYNYYSYIEDLYDDYEVVVPVKVAEKMAEAGFHADGTEMTSAEIKEWKEQHTEDIEPEDENDQNTGAEAQDDNLNEHDNSSSDPDANTPAPLLNQE